MASTSSSSSSSTTTAQGIAQDLRELMGDLKAAFTSEESAPEVIARLFADGFFAFSPDCQQQLLPVLQRVGSQPSNFELQTLTREVAQIILGDGKKQAPTAKVHEPMAHVCPWALVHDHPCRGGEVTLYGRQVAGMEWLIDHNPTIPAPGTPRTLNLRDAKHLDAAKVKYLLQGIRNLDGLVLDNTALSDEAIRGLAGYLKRLSPNLRKLSLNATKISDASLKELLNALPNLESLSIANCENLTDDALIALTVWARSKLSTEQPLREVGLTGAPNWTSEIVTGFFLATAGLRQARFANLPNLSTEHEVMIYEHLMKESPDLQSLALDQTELPLDLVKQFPESFSKLTDLRLHQCDRFSKSFLRDLLPRWTGLQSLMLRGSHVDGETLLATVTSNPGLRTLVLDLCPRVQQTKLIEVAKVLQKHGALEELSLTWSPNHSHRGQLNFVKALGDRLEQMHGLNFVGRGKSIHGDVLHHIANHCLNLRYLGLVACSDLKDCDLAAYLPFLIETNLNLETLQLAKSKAGRVTLQALAERKESRLKQLGLASLDELELDDLGDCLPLMRRNNRGLEVIDVRGSVSEAERTILTANKDLQGIVWVQGDSGAYPHEGRFYQTI